MMDKPRGVGDGGWWEVAESVLQVIVVGIFMFAIYGFLTTFSW